MDLIEATSQGIGLALAAGMFAGALAGIAEASGDEMTPISLLLLTMAVFGGAIMFGASLATEDHPAWPGWPVGAALAAFAFFVVRDVVTGAARRGGAEGSPVLIAFMAMAAALFVGGVSLLFGYLGPLTLV